MTQYLLRRLFYFVPVVFLVTVVVFCITLLLPGDPALAFLGEANINDKVAYQAMRQELGLDQPIYVQYGMWVGRAWSEGTVASWVMGLSSLACGTAIAVVGIRRAAPREPRQYRAPAEPAAPREPS